MQLGDKHFEKFISAEEIELCVVELAKRIDEDYTGKSLVLIGVLNGSFMLLSDLAKKMKSNPEIHFVKYASYEGTTSTGNVRPLLSLDIDLTEKHVLIVEDIIDTGQTIEKVSTDILKANPMSMEFVSLLLKPTAYHKSIPIKYVGKEIPNNFVVGYGMDYNGLGRSFGEIYRLISHHELPWV